MIDNKILNSGLEFALEFGSNWLQPIHSRLSNKFPDLTPGELNYYDSVCRAAMKKGHDYIHKTLETAAKDKRKIKANEMADGLRLFLHMEYPWIDSGNIKKILNQGFYYAWKDGLDKSISD